MSDTNQEDCEKVVDEIEKMRRNGLVLKCDVSSRNEVEDMVKRTVAEFGRVDILVNNAGIIACKPFLELTDEDWDRTSSINPEGQFLCARAAREMVKGKRGRIVNIASISSGGCGTALPLIAHYTASKGGVVALTETLTGAYSPGHKCECDLPGGDRYRHGQESQGERPVGAGAGWNSEKKTGTTRGNCRPCRFSGIPGVRSYERGCYCY